VKLLLDMHLSMHLAAQLRSDGHDVFQLRERGLQQLDDFSILALAAAEDRAIVTFDLDFSALLAQSGDRLPSIIQFRTHNTRTLNVHRLLSAILPAHEMALSQGCIVTVGPDKTRVRRLRLS
jgi:predicted nuclease of predicted toxin-antitoxin system